MNTKPQVSAFAARAAAGLWLLIIALVPATHANANLITNGTFDTNANGWISGSIAANGGFQSGIGNPAGSFLLHWGGHTDSDPFIQQTISGLTPGQTYALNWDLLHHSGTQHHALIRRVR